MASKIRVGLIFGGRSGEHEVSITSALSIYHALDKSKYDVTLIGIDKNGRWLMPEASRVLAHSENPRLLGLNREKNEVSLVPYEHSKQLISLTQGAAITTSHMDVILPILHGTYGEDGTIQGLLEMAGIPYVGSGVLGSAIGMDKDVARRLLKADGIPVVPTLCLQKIEFQKSAAQMISRIKREFQFPLFVKPANAGSSVGVQKVKSEDQLQASLEEAFDYDSKVLVEKAIQARELECSVLGNHDPRASVVGEVIPNHEFYSYEAKYIDENGASFAIPAKDLPVGLSEKIQELSIQAFRTLECRGLARVDFFLDKKSGEVFLNEINTIPGFTKISMYPKMWEASGLPYSKLLDELIQLALQSAKERRSLRTTFEAP